MVKKFELKRTDRKEKAKRVVVAEQTNDESEWKALCPYHQDSDPSLYVNVEKRTFYCQACKATGKSKDTVVIDWANPIAEWIYTDEVNNNVSKKMKYPKSIDGGVNFDKKTFLQYIWSDGGWGKGLKIENSVLYNLPNLARAEKGSNVFIVEGEKDADNLNKHYLATTTSFGAEKWSSQYNKYFKDLNVYIIPDEDAPGYRHAIKVANELKGIAASIKLVFLAKDNSPEGYDFSNWIEDGHTIEEFDELLENAPDYDILLLSKYQEASSGNEVDFDFDDKPKEFHLTDAGNAERFASQHGGEIRFNSTSDKWLYFDGKRWNPTTGKAMAERLAIQTARSMLDDAQEMQDTDKRNKLIKWSMKSEMRNALKSMQSIAKSLEPILTDIDKFDTDQYLLNVENGTVNLKTGELQAHKPNDMITYLAPVLYNENADCSLWLDCLATWMDGDAEAIDYLQRLGGMCLTGDISSRVFPIFHGTGKNGKSVFLDTVKELMGDYAATAPSGLLSAANRDSHPTAIAGLVNKRLVIISETHKGMKLRADMVKSMTGDATISARFMRQDFFELLITFKVILVSQNLPDIDESSDAIWDRVHKIGWKVRITKEQQNNHLLSDLENERSGILNWLIEGCLKWQEDGCLEPTQDIVSETNKYRKESEPLSEFIDEKCEVNEDCKIRKTELYDAYFAWTDDRSPMNNRAFNKELTDLGYESKNCRIDKKTAKCWIGIKLKPDEVVETEDVVENLTDSWSDLGILEATAK